MEDTAAWVAEQKKEDIFEEIIYKSKKVNLTHLRRVGWNGFPDRLRAPCWQILLQYLPTSPSKQRSTLRRKRNEYHRYITKYYFEFDFCLTDRKLPSSNDKKRSALRRSPGKTKSMNSLSRREHFSKSSSITTDGSKNKLVNSSDSRLLPLFSQPTSSKENITTVSAREDSLLLRIREDINGMVEVPIQSSSKSVAEKKSLQTKKSMIPNVSEINGSSKTTKNRLFSNSLIKASLERIIYLWSTRIADDPSPYPSRYIPEIVDIIYPLYLTNLHGYIWDNHVSTTVDKTKVVTGDDRKSLSSIRRISMTANDLNLDYFDLDEVKLSSSEPTIYEDEDRQSRIRLCEKLAIGVGIDAIPEEILEEVEADTYWCLENFMIAVQDYRYNHAFSGDPSTTSKQTTHGMQRNIALMEKVVQRVDPALYKHLKSKGVEYIWFTYRWLNSLHVRDFNEKCILRLWDTCICEETDKESGNYFSTFGFNAKRARKRLHLAGFLNFQVYICTALLHRMRKRVLAQETFQDILFELRNPSLDNWGPEDVEILLSQAYVWSSSFHGSEEQIVQSCSEEQTGNIFKTWAKLCHWPPRKSTSRSMTAFDKSISMNPRKHPALHTH